MTEQQESFEEAVERITYEDAHPWRVRLKRIGNFLKKHVASLAGIVRWLFQLAWPVIVKKFFP